jgi:DNA primase
LDWKGSNVPQPNVSQDAVDRINHLPSDEWNRLVESIRENMALQDVIEVTGFQLEESGRELRGVDHDSLVVHPQKQVYKWYRMGEGGDVFTWVCNRYHVDLNTAIAMLMETDLLPRAHVTEPHRAQPVEAAVEPLPQDLHLRCHQDLDKHSREWWHAQGIKDEAIARFFLGMHRHAVYGRCFTIPIIERGVLVNLRMRIENPEKPKDKYRPWDRGRGTQLFNRDVLTPELGGVVIVAGEKKAITLWQYGIPAVSPTGGCSNWKPEWTTALQFCRKVYIAFDPTETPAAWKLAQTIGERAHILTLPDKPDDWILANGEHEFRKALKYAEPFADRDYWLRQNGGKSMWGRELP